MLKMYLLRCCEDGVDFLLLLSIVRTLELRVVEREGPGQGTVKAGLHKRRPVVFQKK